MVDCIRPATLTDVSALVRLNAEVQGMHAAQYPELFVPVADESAVAAFFADVMAKDCNEIGLYAAAGEPLGYIWIELQHRDATAFTKPWSRGYVHHLSVAEAARRQGVATALMQWAEARAHEMGVEMLALDHWAANPAAAAFYDQLGFEPTRVVRVKMIAGGS
jgi:ribosomal protein S18 acetylase RimI-like enzyme